MRIGVTSGDVNGIGLEILLKSLNHFEDDFILYSNPITFDNYVSRLEDHKPRIYNNLEIRNIGIESEINFGVISKDSGKHAARSIEQATEDVINKEIDAIVTLPINKKSFYDVDWAFPGHTEYFASKFPQNTFNMILCDKKLRVIPLTIHDPIKDVSSKISSDLIIRKSKSFHDSLKKDFAINNPKIAILGLNPHAGENGSIGSEEIDTILPSIRALQENGFDIQGPFPADGFFGFGQYENFDGIISMYHDQGLIPLKLLSKGAGVNFTSGLPIVRTSPDHGTGFDISGKNISNETSLVNSIQLAIEIVKNRNK